MQIIKYTNNINIISNNNINSNINSNINRKKMPSIYNYMATLTHDDYRVVLKYYGINKKTMTVKQTRTAALDILANKLCRCIKKIGDDKQGIAICKNSVLGKKSLKNGRFTCKKRAKLLTDGKNKEPLLKTKKQLSIKNKKKTRSKRSVSTTRNFNSRVYKVKSSK